MGERIKDNQVLGVYFKDKTDHNNIQKYGIAVRYTHGDHTRYSIRMNERLVMDCGEKSIQIDAMQFSFPELSSYLVD